MKVIVYKIVWTLITALCMTSALYAKISQSAEKNPYGSIVATDVNVEPYTNVQHVGLQVPKHHGSKEIIARNGVLTLQEDAKATILMCHGFMTCCKDIDFLRHLLFANGKYNFFTFDFRAHGENAQGQRCTFGYDEACEVITAVHFLKQHKATKGKPIILYAFSMGAVASIEAQAKDPSLFDAMILDCPFDSSETVIKQGLDNMRFQFFGYRVNVPAREVLQKYAFHPYVQAMLKAFLKSLAYVDIRNIDVRLYPVNTAAVIHKVKVPVLMFGCKNDEKVPRKSVELLFENLGSLYKILYMTDGRCHYDSLFFNTYRYKSIVNNFVEDFLEGKFNNVTKKEIHIDKTDFKEKKGFVWGIGKLPS